MTTRRPRLLDEEDVRVRPRRSSRPRSKQRPSHNDSSAAFVVAVDRGRFTVALDADSSALVHAVKARELGRKGVVVGDRVDVGGDLSGRPDALARIVRRGPRRSVLRRSTDDSEAVERVVVANADQLAVVVAVTEPAPQLRLVDRALVAAFDGDLQPLLVITKTDLGDWRSVASHYGALNLRLVQWRSDSGRVEELRAILHDKVTVLFGASGVGKSTLSNRLVPGSDRVIGAVNEVTGRGRHTSSSAVALPLNGGGWLIDTPGVRSLGLAHVDAGRILRAFPDLVPGTGACPRGCTHGANSPRCALDEWVRTGHAQPLRLASLRRLLSSREA